MDERYARKLYETEGFGSRTIFRIRHVLKDGNDFAEEIWKMPEEKLFLMMHEADAADRTELLINERRKDPEAEGPFKGMPKRGGPSKIRFASFDSPLYPEKLTRIPDPPFGIYFIGTLPKEEAPACAVIGARESTIYGREMAGVFARALAEAGVLIISGMARGIDGIAGMTALQAGGYSLAVLGCGADVCYPPQNRELYERLCSEGCVFSEYPPGTRPQARLFPPRNRIISALSDLVLVIEARERSGTLITVDMALEQGKDIYALPGRICDGTSRGCNELIRQGAGIAVSPDAVLQALGRDPSGKEEAGGEGAQPLPAGLTPLQKKILLHLDMATPRSLDSLLEAVEEDCGYAVLRQEMTLLEIRGLVRETGIGHFVSAVLR